MAFNIYNNFVILRKLKTQHFWATTTSRSSRQCCPCIEKFPLERKFPTIFGNAVTDKCCSCFSKWKLMFISKRQFFRSIALLQCRQRTILDPGFSQFFFATVFVVAHWINSWIKVHDAWTANPVWLILWWFNMGDVLLLCFGNCGVYCGGKAFSIMLLELAVGDSIELFSLRSAGCGYPRLIN